MFNLLTKDTKHRGSKIGEDKFETMPSTRRGNKLNLGWNCNCKLWLWHHVGWLPLNKDFVWIGWFKKSLLKDWTSQMLTKVWTSFQILQHTMHKNLSNCIFMWTIIIKGVIIFINCGYNHGFNFGLLLQRFNPHLHKH